MLVQKMFKQKVLSSLYKGIGKPLFFSFDAEVAHNLATSLGEFLGESDLTQGLLSSLYDFKDNRLNKEVLGVVFKNPVGLAAGFDYDGHLSAVLKSVGFGFNTVGTVTAKPYEGNKTPRLDRLVKSQSLLVNKGFKSAGANEVRQQLDNKNLANTTLGISVGSSNVPEVDSVHLAIEDYLYTFDLFKDRDYVDYFELNISCPNTSMTESFVENEYFEMLCAEVSSMNLSKPIFVKMPNETPFEQQKELVNTALKKDIRGFIFSNLVKDRNNKYLDKEEIERVKDLKGNFSGKPTSENSLALISAARKEFGDEIAIIGCGGIFSSEDAKQKLDAGADLVQLITGMIFEGPQLISEINSNLVHSSYMPAD